MEQKRFREMSIHQKHPNHSTVTTDFSICISLYHALELLERHGIRVFLNFFEDASTDHNQSLKARNEKFFVAMNPKLKKFIEDLRQRVGSNPFLLSDQTMTNGQIPKIPDNLDFGHPKFEIIEKILKEHFEKENDSKVIIFCEYRESVLLIHKSLLRNRPLIRPKIFVGQGGVGSVRAVTQKQQIQIMSDFRNGISNTLIATSVAEEGIDVGDVDLIICFDINTKNPTRFVQRIGRTGRKKQGNVIVLVTEGKEHAMVKEVLATKDKTNQKIAKSREIQQRLYKKSPRLVPPEFDPKCVQTFIQVQEKPEEKSCENLGKKKNQSKKRSINENFESNLPNEVSSSTTKRSRGRPSKKSSQAHGSNDVRNFFKKVELDNEEKEIFNVPNQKSKNSRNNDWEDNIFYNDDNTMTAVDESNEINQKEDHKEMMEGIKTNFQSLIRKLNNFTRRVNYSAVESGIIKTPSEVLKSKCLSKQTKRFYLEQQSYGYVKEKFEAIEAVDAAIVDMADDEIGDEIVRLKEEFSILEDIFGGRSEIMQFLESNKAKQVSESKNGLRKLDEKFADLFEGLEKRDLFENIEDFVGEELKKIEQNEVKYRKFPYKKEENKSVFNDTCFTTESLRAFMLDEEETESKELSMDDEFSEIGSKYLSQWTQFKSNDMKTESTPLKKLNKEEGRENENEVPIDESYFFDDDFNDMLAASSNSLLENKTEKRKETEVKKSNTIDEKENIPENCLDKRVLSPMFEDFNLDDFFEPFDDEEEEYQNDALNNRGYNGSNSTSVNMFNSVDKSINNKTENMLAETRGQTLNHNYTDNQDKSVCLETHKNINSKSPKFEGLATSDKLSSNDADIPNLAPPPPTVNTSPSVLRRRVNLSKLKIFNSEGPQLHISNSDRNSCHYENVTKSEETKTVDENFQTSTIAENDEVDNSVIGNKMMKKPKRRIESSESASSECEDEILFNQKRTRKRFHNHKRTKRRKCSFLDEEAECSDDQNSREEEEDGNCTRSQYILDSIVVDDIEEPSVTMNMHAKYLQSIRSPRKATAGRFKIPLLHAYPTLSQVCSQTIVEDDLNEYKEDSFVVSDDEIIPECEVNETCFLSRAEALLENRKKMRKMNRIRNRKAIEYEDNSDEEW